MNAWAAFNQGWPLLGALALELAIVFVVAKLVVWRVHATPWRRALWQTCVVAMLLVALGELNGVRGFFQLPAKPTATTQHMVVVTFKEPDVAQPVPAASAPMLPRRASATSAAPSPWPPAWPLLIWAAGLGLILARAAFAQAVALALRWAGRRVNSTELTARAEGLARLFGIRRRVVLLESRRMVAPFTFGLWTPVIVLPRHFLGSLTVEQQDAVLVHELAHVAGFDSAWRGLSGVVCALLWWHPCAWLARRELAHASELVADEASLLTAVHRLLGVSA